MSVVEQNHLVEYFLQKGRQEGRQEGRQQGKEEALRQMIVRLATKRFGPLPSALVEQIPQQSLLKLESLLDSILDLPDLDALTRALSS